MKTTTELKYKFLGLFLISFIIFWLFLWLGPKKGIEPLLLNSNSINSIQTYNLENDFIVTSRKDIDTIVQELRKAVRLKNVEGININTAFYHLNFYLKGQQKPISIRILNNRYNGIIIRANDYIYKGTSLDSIIKGLANTKTTSYLPQ